MTPRQASSVRNILAGWGSFVVAAAAGLYLSPRTVAALGDDGYGTWVLIGSLTGPLSLLDLGVRSAMTKLIAKHAAALEHAQASRIASTARVLYLGSAVCAVLISGVIAAWLPAWFNVPGSLGPAASLAVITVGAAVATTLYTGLYGGVLAGVRRLDLVGLSGAGLEMVRVPLMLMVLASGTGVTGLAALAFVLAAARLVFQRFAAQRCYPQLSITFARPQRQDLLAILDVSLFSTGIYALGTLSGQAGVYVLGATLPMATVTAYAIGGTLPQYLNSLTLPVAQNVLAEASRLHALGQREEVHRILLRSGKWAAFVILPIVVGFLTRGGTFLEIWMGESYRVSSGPVLMIFSLASVFSLSRHVLQTAFIATGAHRHLIAWYAVEAAMIVTLAIVLTSGGAAVGAAWAQVVPAMLLGGLVLPAMCQRHIGLSMRRQYWNFVVRPALALIPFAAVLLVVDTTFEATGYFGFFLQSLACVPVALLGVLYIGLSLEERQILIARIRSRVGRQNP